MILSSRECLADIANALNLQTAVEVGTHQAVFAKMFMQRFRGTISLVDPWEGFTEGFDTYYPALEEDSRDREHDFHIAQAEMSEFNGRVSFMKMKSEEAVLSFEDDSVGIVYIDGLHEYEDTSRDIAIWYPKVKRGGIISGHDFNSCLPGVVHAVEEFRKTFGLQVFLTLDGMSSWWVVKK